MSISEIETILGPSIASTLTIRRVKNGYCKNYNIYASNCCTGPTGPRVDPSVPAPPPPIWQDVDEITLTYPNSETNQKIGEVVEFLKNKICNVKWFPPYQSITSQLREDKKAEYAEFERQRQERMDDFLKGLEYLLSHYSLTMSDDSFPEFTDPIPAGFFQYTYTDHAGYLKIEIPVEDPIAAATVANAAAAETVDRETVVVVEGEDAQSDQGSSGDQNSILTRLSSYIWSK
jgi:hypothetical protein